MTGNALPLGAHGKKGTRRKRAMTAEMIHRSGLVRSGPVRSLVSGPIVHYPAQPLANLFGPGQCQKGLL